MHIKIGEILNSQIGSKFSKMIPVQLTKIDDFQLDPEQNLELEIFRVPHGLAVIIQPQKLTGQAMCGRSLVNFRTNIVTVLSEEHFYTEAPEHDDLEEYALIKQKSCEIDLEPVINQAVLLAVPAVFYKPGTKPLHKMDSTGNKPFANLKDLLK